MNLSVQLPAERLSDTMPDENEAPALFSQAALILLPVWLLLIKKVLKYI